MLQRRPGDPRERIRKEQDGIVLSPQRRSFNSGCFVTQTQPTAVGRRPESPTGKADRDRYGRVRRWVSVFDLLSPYKLRRRSRLVWSLRIGREGIRASIHQLLNKLDLYWSGMCQLKWKKTIY